MIRGDHSATGTSLIRPQGSNHSGETACGVRLTLLIFALAVQPMLWPASAQAAAPSDCSAYLDSLAKDLATNTTLVDDYARPNSPSPDHVAQSASRYNRDANYLKQCSASKKPYVDALLTTWSAWLEHATTHVNPIDTANRAAQQLQKCSAAYNATANGATCTQWEKQVAKWQDEWGSP